MAGRWVTAAAGLALLLGAGPVMAQGKVQKVSKDLVDRAEDTRKSVEEAEKQLKKVVERYGKLLGADSVDDRRDEHGKVRDELKDLESRAQDVRERSRSMEEEASKFFAEWTKSLDGIKDTELRTLSRQSMSDAQTAYGQVVATGRKVADQYDAFVTTLTAQLKYLEVDLSDKSLDKLKSSDQDLRGQAKELQSRVGGLKAEIKRYVEAMK